MKERLVGAAVLVAIGAWLIPWVLDGPQHLDATQQTTALELPAPGVDEPVLRTETVVLDRQESPVPTQPVTPSSAASEAPQSAPPATPTVPSVESEPAAPPPARPASPQSPAPAEPDATAAATQWYVQVGAFGNVDNANRLATRVATYGYEARVSAAPGGGRTMHRVRVGPEPTRAQAEAIMSALSAHGFVPQVVFE